MKACKHIAFFYREDRLNYLNQMIQAVNTYPFYTDIFIHTNHIFDTETLATPTNGEIFLIGHDLSKKDPMRLPWYVRPLMKSQKDSYTIFIYTEDDILIPKEAIEYWLTNKDLYKNGYNLGFLRMETDCEGTEFISDLHNEHSISQQLTKTLQIDKKPYAINDVNPYTAFWIYDSKEFSRFLLSPHWNPETLLPMYGVREAAAIGMASTRTSFKNYIHTLIPLTQEFKVHPNCRVYHLANNYVDMPYCFFASLLFEEAVAINQQTFRHPNEVIQRKHARLLRQSKHPL